MAANIGHPIATGTVEMETCDRHYCPYVDLLVCCDHSSHIVSCLFQPITEPLTMKSDFTCGWGRVYFGSGDNYCIASCRVSGEKRSTLSVCGSLLSNRQKGINLNIPRNPAPYVFYSLCNDFIMNCLSQQRH
jgi:hypothetical protein